MVLENAVATWDFTLWDKENKLNKEGIIEWLTKFSKKYAFQWEDAGSGKHYQGRISLKVKKRSLPEIKWGIQWRLTSGASCKDEFYVLKEDTRVEGPWTDRDEIHYVPRQIREIEELLPWQNSVIEISRKWDPRSINVIVDENGCKGKSILVGKMCCELKIAKKVPALNNFKDILNIIYCMKESKIYLIDMPRAMDKSKQEEFYSAMESIKDGHIWDNRYTYKERWQDAPNVWIFTNAHPNKDLLSKDRWKIWTIGENKELKGVSL